MKWEMEKINNAELYRWEHKGIKAVIEYAYDGFAKKMAAYLTISMDTVYVYGNSMVHSITPPNAPELLTSYKQVALITSYTEIFHSVEEAKGKAEELIPVFRIAQANKIT